MSENDSEKLCYLTIGCIYCFCVNLFQAVTFSFRPCERSTTNQSSWLERCKQPINLQTFYDSNSSHDAMKNYVVDRMLWKLGSRNIGPKRDSNCQQLPSTIVQNKSMTY